ncbi:MAG: U32 family peptidase [Verrucomicrobia bacterium]|nr:U32 family peptidase [Verrucomicrobiota bacterium]
MMPRTKPEIMSPAGNWTTLHAAMQAGADAIYFGLRGFNMRDNADNFRPSELPRIARTCHGAGVRAYLALNTIIYEHEVRPVRRILEAAVAAGIDAVIGWDMAVIQTATALGLPVFLSTQMSVSNSASLAAFHRAFGIRRFVLARECTLAQIRGMRRKLGTLLGAAAAQIEIEVFAHGAMCVSISGRCFLSESSVGKSANRGQCTQPCRRPYQITGSEGEVAFRMGDQYLLSPQDLCTLPFLEQVLAAGVNSLKLEGRGRAPEYVSTVTAAYRRAVDFHFDNRHRPGFKAEFQALKETLMSGLEGVYHRGLASGFYLGAPLDQWSGAPNSQAATKKLHVGEVVKFYRKAGAVELRVCDTEFAIGDELLIQGPTTGVVRVCVNSIQIDHQPMPHARRGQSVAVQLNTPVRPGDRVYRVTSRRQ